MTTARSRPALRISRWVCRLSSRSADPTLDGRRPPSVSHDGCHTHASSWSPWRRPRSSTCAASAARHIPSGPAGAPGAATGTRSSRRSPRRRAHRSPWQPLRRPAVQIGDVDTRRRPATADRDRRTRPGARRRPRAGSVTLARRRAGHRQEHAAAAAARLVAGPHAVRHRRGERPAGEAARRAARRRPRRPVAARRDVAARTSSTPSTTSAPSSSSIDSIQTVCRSGARFAARQRRAGARRAPIGSCSEAKRRGVADRARRPRHQGRRARRAAGARARRRHGAAVRGRSSPRAAPAAGHRSTASDRPNELGLFEMATAGLVGVPDPSALFLADRRTGIPGSAVVPTIEGQRPMRGRGAGADQRRRPGDVPARRSAQGLDGGRLVAAAGGARARAPACRSAISDVYASTVGGVRLIEPGLDLGVCLAVVSALARPAAAGRPGRVR